MLVATELGNGWFKKQLVRKFLSIRDLVVLSHRSRMDISSISHRKIHCGYGRQNGEWLWIDAEKYLDSLAWSANEENCFILILNLPQPYDFTVTITAGGQHYSQIQNLNY